MPTSSAAGDRLLATLEVADLDGDGRNDVLASGWQAESVAATLEVFLGDGNGAVALPLSFPLGANRIVELRVADLNTDGALDAVALTDDAHLWPIFGDGEGSFFPPAPIQVDVSFVGGLDVADVDADGHLDAIVSGSVMLPNPAYPSNNTCGTPPKLTCCICGPLPPPQLPSPRFVVLAGLGDGTFGAPTSRTLAAVGYGVQAIGGDFDQDSIQDLAFGFAVPPTWPDVSSPQSGRLTILRGDGSPSFGAEGNTIPVGVPVEIHRGHFNQDSFLDLVVSYGNTYGGGGAIALSGAGDATFTAAFVPSLGSGTGLSDSDSLDMNLDGLDDMVVATRSGQVQVAFGSALGLAAGGAYEIAAGASIAAEDLTSDGAPDLVLAIPGSGALTVVQADGGRLVAPRSVGSNPGQVMAGHFDSDAVLDLLVMDSQLRIFLPPPDFGEDPPPEVPEPSAQLVVYPGVGGGALGAPSITGGPSGGATFGALADFNADGLADVVSVGAAPEIAATQGIEIWLGTGARTFSRSARVPLPVGPVPIVTGDVDRDEKADAVVVYQRSTDLSAVAAVLRGDGLGGLGAAQELVVLPNASPERAVLADVTGDAVLDLLVTATAAAGTLVVMPGDGLGGFAAGTSFDAGLRARGLATADLDLDGALDVLVGNVLPAGGGLRIWFGDGAGGFEPAADVNLIQPGPSAITSGDFDGNGTVDLALAGAVFDARAEILSGQGDGTFAVPLTLPVLADSLAVGDFDADGKLDVVTSGGELNGRISMVVNSDATFDTCPSPPCTSFAVRPIDPTRGTAPVEITFAFLGEAGLTNVTSNTFGPLPPFGFKLGTPSEYFHIYTTALFSGFIDICIDYNPLGYLNPADVRLFHYDNGVWNDTTTTNDSANGRICGQTLSLSPFALVEPIPEDEPEVIVLNATKDAVIHRNEPNLNGGANTRLTVSDNSRVLVAFDLDGFDLSRVESAQLVMTVDDVDGAGRGVVVDAYRVTGAWAEGNGRNGFRNELGSSEGTTWNCATDGNIGNRAPNCASRWRGGALAGRTAEGVLHNRSTSGEVTWDVTGDVLAGATNGWLVGLRCEQGEARVVYAARDTAHSPSADSVGVPRLVLNLAHGATQ